MFTQLQLTTRWLPSLTRFGFLMGAALLALEPALWLVGTWHHDGYDGVGWVAFVLVTALFAWSVASPVRGAASANPRTFLLLIATAAIRLLAELLAVNVIGALLLAVDVYALGSLARLQHRARAISPFWLALLFSFSLPIEPMVQRLIGYDLQLLSAGIACGMLQPLFDQLACSGARLQINGLDVLVDLPCSGAELVSISGLVFTLINTIRRPTTGSAIFGGVFCALAALAGNGLRIALLAAGIAEESALPFHVMDPLPHTLLGIAVISLVSGLLLVVAGRYRVTGADSTGHPEKPQRDATAMVCGQSGRSWYSWRRFSFSCVFFCFALIVGAVQPRPVDASPRISSPEIPLFAADFSSSPSPLTQQELDYFTRYGGAASRASFGPFGLLVVSTHSPLRHLHDPTICLSGGGYSVRFLGTDHETTSTLYLAESPATGASAAGVSAAGASATWEGSGETARYMVRVSYLSDSGLVASSVSEVVWHWLRAPGQRWTMVQRIFPEHPAVDPESAARWEVAVRRAFNLS